MDLTKEVERCRTSPSEHRPATSLIYGKGSRDWCWDLCWYLRLKVILVERHTRVVVGRHEELLPILTMASLSHSCV